MVVILEGVVACAAHHHSLELRESWLQLHEETLLLNSDWQRHNTLVERKASLDLQEGAKLWIQVAEPHFAFLEPEHGLLTGYRNVRDGDLVVHPASNVVLVFDVEVDDMDGFRGAVDIWFDDDVTVCLWPINVQQKGLHSWHRCTLHLEIKRIFAKFTDQVLPVVRADSTFLLLLLLTVSPLPQAIQMDVFHGPCTLARGDKWVVVLQVFFFVKADATAATRFFPTRALCSF